MPTVRNGTKRICIKSRNGTIVSGLAHDFTIESTSVLNGGIPVRGQPEIRFYFEDDAALDFSEFIREAGLSNRFRIAVEDMMGIKNLAFQEVSYGMDTGYSMRPVAYVSGRIYGIRDHSGRLSAQPASSIQVQDAVRRSAGQRGFDLRDL